MASLHRTTVIAHQISALMCRFCWQALERQRLKRMRDAGGDDDEFASDADDAAAPLGGYARRRHKAARAVGVQGLWYRMLRISNVSLS